MLIKNGILNLASVDLSPKSSIWSSAAKLTAKEEFFDMSGSKVSDCTPHFPSDRSGRIYSRNARIIHDVCCGTR